jgi:N utilization substance protein B
VFTLALPVRIADYVKKESGIKSSKLLPTEQDLQFSTRLANNPIIRVIRADKKVSECLKLAVNDEEITLVKDLFKIISEEDEYKLYCSNQNAGNDEKEIIVFILNKVIPKSQSYLQYVEDNFSECTSELNKMTFAITESLEKLASGEQPGMLEFQSSDAEELFAKELLEKTIINQKQFTELIQPKLKNWDVDRIARIDMVLMKMALCELLNFDQIPVKVSINEYIDISKTYSTPRSKDFINGILDSIMHELKDKHEIRKTGRGLVE